VEAIVRAFLAALIFCLALPIYASSGLGETLVSRSNASTKDIDDRVAEWLKTCLADWDSETHMSKAEWRSTCQRVSAERRKFLIEEAEKGVSFDPIDRTLRKGGPAPWLLKSHSDSKATSLSAAMLD
jgi:hypothetical protein